MHEIMFYYFAVVAVVTALLAISRPNPVHSVLFLVPCFFHVAGLFVLLGAEFLAAIQILVPAGALMVLYLFVVFLFNLSEVRSRTITHRQASLAGIVAVVLVFMLVVLSVRGLFPGPFAELVQVLPPDNTMAVGGSLYTTFLFPFELASLILLVVMFGAIVLAKREERE
ncbi:MAG: NADH-quinone oxidoreductase subunit J [bacterium]|nr:MAG: NADH-quinone oxidoreductase subunit J [bacterium]